MYKHNLIYLSIYFIVLIACLHSSESNLWPFIYHNSQPAKSISELYKRELSSMIGPISKYIHLPDKKHITDVHRFNWTQSGFSGSDNPNDRGLIFKEWALNERESLDTNNLSLNCYEFVLLHAFYKNQISKLQIRQFYLNYASHIDQYKNDHHSAFIKAFSSEIKGEIRLKIENEKVIAQHDCNIEKDDVISFDGPSHVALATGNIVNKFNTEILSFSPFPVWGDTVSSASNIAPMLTSVEAVIQYLYDFERSNQFESPTNFGHSRYPIPLNESNSIKIKILRPFWATKSKTPISQRNTSDFPDISGINNGQ